MAVRVINSSDSPRFMSSEVLLCNAEPVQVIDDDETIQSCQNRVYDDPTATAPKKIDDDNRSCQEHIKEFIESLSTELSESELKLATEFVINHADLFSKSKFDLGRTKLKQHHIDTGNNRPFKQALRRHPIAHQ